MLEVYYRHLPIYAKVYSMPGTGLNVQPVEPAKPEAGAPGADSAVTPEQKAVAAPQTGAAAATPDSLPGADSRQDAVATPRDEDARVDFAAVWAVKLTASMSTACTAIAANTAFRNRFCVSNPVSR